MVENNLQEDVALFRRFNRFYTKQIGLLTQGLLKTRFPLIQARVLYELAQQDQTTASVLVDKLNIDPGYLSRILGTFEKEGLLRKNRSPFDSRQRILKLTNRGKKSFADLDERSRKVAEKLLQGLVKEDLFAWVGPIAVDVEVDPGVEHPRGRSGHIDRRHGAGRKG